jgi:hypothetical protein
VLKTFNIKRNKPGGRHAKFALEETVTGVASFKRAKSKSSVLQMQQI